MKPAPPDHLALLNRKFVFDCAVHIFSDEEILVLKRFGVWLTALAEGLIEPITPAQVRFVKCVWENLEPKTEFERVYLKLRDRREFEAECLTKPTYQVVDKGHEWSSWFA